MAEPVIPATIREQLTGWRLYVLLLALGIANTMMALDASVMAPALPAITTEFRTVDDIGWYSSVYLLVQMSCQPVFGRLLQFYEPKMFYLVSLVIFLVGSIVCATSPSSIALVLGRAVAGSGGAGIICGSLAIFGDTAPMRERPRGLAVISALQSVAYLAGPILSGVLTDSWLTWRFNFWINLPIGFVSFIAVFLVVKRYPSPRADVPLIQKIWGTDPGGAIILTGSFVCLFLALQWGGNVLPFSSPQVWGCFLGFGLLAISFAAWETWRKDEAIIPLRILKQRTVAVCCIFSILYGIASITYSMLLPTYFQTVHGATATMSGIYYMPMTIVSVVGIVITGFSITAWGHYVPFIWIGPLIFLAGSVLFHLLEPSSTTAQYLGYQVLTGLGFGLCIHVSLVAVQVVSLPEDMPTACVTEMLCGQIGGAVGASIAQNLFLGTLRDELREIVGPKEAVAFANSGLKRMVESMKTLEVGLREQFRQALNDSVTTAFIVPIAVTVLAEV
ncbi:hypothetical protein ACRALDRAFT_1073124, partial [Sodiomyces alcalophilus JCM 7366]|uniref:uncharacterized protein n=1 Tax=Sodiomyces alcalophilus JCM 7366 TaxID=591952 RepID=UPI0039B599F8